MLHRYRDPHTGLYGYKNDEGATIISARFEKAADFSNGLAEVYNDGKSGLINEAGSLVLPIEFDMVFASGSGWVQAKKADEYSLFNHQGDEQLCLRNILAWHFPEQGLIRVKTGTGWGCVNLDGAPVVPSKYKSLGPVFRDRIAYFENGCWGWLNITGEVLTTAAFDEVGWWSENQWWARSNGHYCLYNLEDQLVIDKGWTRIVEPQNGLAIVKNAEGWRYINDCFETVLKFPALYEWMEHFHGNYAAVKFGDAWGFVNRNGTEVVLPQFEQVRVFSEGLAAIRNGGLWGYINETGAVVIPCTFHSAGAFRNGLALVGGSWSSSWYINKTGETVGDIIIADDDDF